MVKLMFAELIQVYIHNVQTKNMPDHGGNLNPNTSNDYLWLCDSELLVIVNVVVL